MYSSTPPFNLLLVEDDAALSSMTLDFLASHGHRVSAAFSLAEAKALLAKHTFDILVLDLGLPDGDGLDFCKSLRTQIQYRFLPILVLSARVEPVDRVLGLELGADDYLAKPFEPRELLARMRALMRRSASSQTTNNRLAEPGGTQFYSYGSLSVDRAERRVYLGESEMTLTPYQFDVLVLFCQNSGRVLSREFIMSRLRENELEVYDRSIDVVVSKLRALLEDDPKAPKRILTIRGLGYVFAKAQA